MGEFHIKISESQDVDCCCELIDCLRLKVKYLEYCVAESLKNPEVTAAGRYFSFGELKALECVLKVFDGATRELSSIT